MPRKPQPLDEARVRTLAFNIRVMADQLLGLRARLAEANDELYSMLQSADPSRDRILERTLVQTCRLLNELHDAHGVREHAQALQRFRLPPEPVQIPDLVGPFTAQVPSSEGCQKGGVGSGPSVAPHGVRPSSTDPLPA